MSALRGSPRTRGVLAWGVFAATCLAVATGARLGSRPGQSLDAVLAVAFTATGALITIHRPGNALGPVGLLMGLAGVAYLADGYASWATESGAPGADAGGWLSERRSTGSIAYRPRTAAVLWSWPGRPVPKSCSWTSRCRSWTAPRRRGGW